MYKNFNITEEERQQILEMHMSHGYKQLLNEQDAATTSIYKGYSYGLGTDEDELVKGFLSIKDLNHYKKVESEIASLGGYATLQDVLNGELNSDDYDVALQIYKHIDSIPGIRANFDFGDDNGRGFFEVGTYKITLSSPEALDDAPNWDKVLNYLKTNKFPPNYTSKIELDNNDDGSTIRVKVYDSQGKRINFRDNGEVFANKKEYGDVFRLGKWTWDGTKPVIPSMDITNPTKSASGFAQNEDDILKNNKILGAGSKNDLVKKIQEKLYNTYKDEINANELPNPGCSLDANENAICDGIFGQKTKQLVSKYQEDNGLRKDGYVGNETYRAMF